MKGYAVMQGMGEGDRRQEAVTHPWDPDDILCLLKPFFSKIILISKSAIVIALLTKHVVSALE